MMAEGQNPGSAAGMPPAHSGKEMKSPASEGRGQAGNANRVSPGSPPGKSVVRSWPSYPGSWLKRARGLPRDFQWQKARRSPLTVAGTAPVLAAGSRTGFPETATSRDYRCRRDRVKLILSGWMIMYFF